MLPHLSSTQQFLFAFCRTPSKKDNQKRGSIIDNVKECDYPQVMLFFKRFATNLESQEKKKKKSSGYHRTSTTKNMIETTNILFHLKNSTEKFCEVFCTDVFCSGLFYPIKASKVLTFAS
jgi:hypothetical protein